MSIAGSWRVVIETAAGPREATLSLQVEGSTLSGSLLDQGGPTDLQGSVAGDEFEFVAATPGMSGPIVMTFSGRVDGDRISGGVDFGQHGAGTWSGARAPD